MEATSFSKVAPRKQKYHISNIKLFGIDLSHGNVVVAMVYFVQDNSDSDWSRSGLEQSRSRIEAAQTWFGLTRLTQLNVNGGFMLLET
ncbi:hypothetical protein CR513_14036, partial [Mucuna pruriens]